ncbi:hypothetical protein [Imhoffiella purpurea]|uniref:Haemin-degrading HemS/ChuX domain-containing protein n=1 Tax=Imhoffiella purpurea TaxID=1249627 RepID=W9V6D8_9GAMM|nr:hypothetical protein [Imhoffiella purpurea]EXJ14939.1 hypothetical protein D779_1994 [Imhoffiella purpurea]
MTAATSLSSIHALGTPWVDDDEPAGRGFESARQSGHWTEMLWDLACLGRVRVETRIPGIQVSQRIHLQGLHLREGLGYAAGPGFELYCLLDAWHAMRPSTSNLSDPGVGLCIEGVDRETLMRVSAEPGGPAFLLKTFLGIHCPHGGRTAPMRADADRFTRLDKWMQTLAAVLRLGGSPPDVGDLAEVGGRLTLNPARMQSRGRARLAAPELVPCFLEAVSDQSLGVRLFTGTRGVAQSCTGCFHSFRQRKGDQLRWSGDLAEVRFDAEAIDSAWVLERPGPRGGRYQLRLYDAEGRALMLIESSEPPGRPENPIWQSLIRALFD